MSMRPIDLERARLELGMTQQELAQHLGLTRTSISHYENGKTRIKRLLVLAVVGLQFQRALQSEEVARRRLLDVALENQEAE